MKELASVRSNLRFLVDRKTAELEPVIEVILLTYKPDYKLVKGEVKREASLEEIRLELSPKALNQLIADMKMTAVELQQFEQAGESINRVLKEMKKQ